MVEHVAGTCRWSKCSWFASAPPDVGLQRSGTAIKAGSGGTHQGGTVVGGAFAQNRFTGRTAVPIPTTAPLEGSPISRLPPLSEPNARAPQAASGVGHEGRREAGGMVSYGGAIAHSRFNDRKRPAGHTCDGMLRHALKATLTSPWTFSWERMGWEKSDGAEAQNEGGEVKHALAARRCAAVSSVLLARFVQLTHRAKV
jgi:hypothetical protein